MGRRATKKIIIITTVVTFETHRTTEEEMEGPISFRGYKEQESNLILPEHDDDDDDDDDVFTFAPCMLLYLFYSNQLMHCF